MATLTDRMKDDIIDNIVKVWEALTEEPPLEPILEEETKAFRKISKMWDKNPGMSLSFSEEEVELRELYYSYNNKLENNRSIKVGVNHNRDKVRGYFKSLLEPIESLEDLFFEYPTISIYVDPEIETEYEKFLPSLKENEVNKVLGW